jgi:hypothetical protein
MHPRPVFAFKPDFKPHGRFPSFLHHFLCFKAWLAFSGMDPRNWSIMFIQSIKCYGIEFDQLNFWPDLRVRSLTNLKLMKFNQAIKQSFVTTEKVFEVSIWSIIARIARFYFWIGNFSPKPLNHFASSLSHFVLLSVLFPTI